MAWAVLVKRPADHIPGRLDEMAALIVLVAFALLARVPVAAIAGFSCIATLILLLENAPAKHSTGGTGWHKGGYKEYPGEYVPCLHDPLLSDAEWDEVIKNTGKVVTFK